MRRRFLVLACFLGTTGSALAQTNLPIQYNAATGFLPDDVTNFNYFARYDAGGSAPSFASASGGILYLVQKGYFEHFSGALDFTSATNVYFLEANLQVVRSDYTVVNGLQRSGHYFEAYDSAGNGFELGISSGGLTLNTDADGAVGQGIPFTAFNPTNGFHDYKIILRAGQALLFIDGKSFGSAALVPGELVGPEVGFGDLAAALGTESGAVELQTLALTSAMFAPDLSVNSATNCAGGSAVLIATTSAINPIFLWSPGGATNGTITVSPTATTTYGVTVTDGPTGLTNHASGTVVVNPLPTVSVNSTASCAGAPVQLTATTSASNPIFLWSPGGATNASIMVSPALTTVYSVVVMDGITGCANSGTGTVTVTPAPSVTVNAPSTCPGNPVQLTVTTSASNPSYLWQPGGQVSSSITVNPTANTTYTVQVTDGVTGCTGSGTGTVIVLMPPLVNSAAACPGDPVILTAKTYASNPHYLWSPGGATTPSITVNPTATTTYTVTVTDGAAGCPMSGTGTVTMRTANGTAYVYGDSVGQGYLVAVTNRFSYLICQALGLTETNLAIGGSQIADYGESDEITSTTIFATNRSLWLAGFNDMRFYGTNAAALADNTSAFQSLVAWLALPTSTRIPANDPRIKYSGNWGARGFLGGLEYSADANSSATVAVAGKNILIGTARGGGAAGNLIVVVDGTFTNVYSCLRTAAHTYLGRDYSAGLILFTNLPDTMHTVVMTAQTSANTFICWVAGYTGDQGPRVALCGTERSPEFVYTNPAFGFFTAGSDAAADAYAGMVSNTAIMLAATGLNVSWTNSPVLDTNLDYESDFLHPNEAGHVLLAARLLPLVSGVFPGASQLSVTQYVGTAASFPAGVAGDDLAYQWQVNTGGGFNNVATGGMTATYTTAPLTLANNGTQYRCVITADCGPAVTNVVTVLSVLAGPLPGVLYPPSLIGSGPAVRLRLLGSPNYGYALEWTHSLTPTIVWLPLVTNSADNFGWVSYTNLPSPSAADFYRARPSP